MEDRYRSPASKAKGLGSGHSGLHHWMHQRFTSVLMLFFIGWNVQLIASINAVDLSQAIEIIKKPYNILVIALFILTVFYHATLGMQIIIEDYTHCRFMRIFLLTLIKIVSIITVASMIVALLYLMTI